MRNFFLSLILLISFCSVFVTKLYSQTDVIEIDTITTNASKGLPYNKPVTVKVRIQTDAVLNVYFVEKYRRFDLSTTIGHYSNKGSYILPEIPQRYYYTKKLGDYNYLFINLTDEYLLKPSSAYYIIIIQPKADPLAFSFFDKYYEFVTTGSATNLTEARDILHKLEDKLAGFFGNLNLGWYDTTSFINQQPFFRASFNSALLQPYTEYTQVKTNYAQFLTTQATVLSAQLPPTDSITFKQLLEDSSINKEAIMYLTAKDIQLNEAASDLNSLLTPAKVSLLLGGRIALGAIYNEPVEENTFAKRVANVETSIGQINNLKKALYLLKPAYQNSTLFNGDIANYENFLNALTASRDSLKKIIAKRQVIEAKIAKEKFATGLNTAKDFSYYAVVSGDSYLNFETRNKVLLTPDFGVVTSSFSKQGKKLDYGIVPYLGFHINFMALDKDISFKSYKKDWKQYLSLMVGWSLVNMNQDTSYASLFEKASLLTGIGFRVNNVIRITGGVQWMFKLGKDADKNPTKRMTAFPFAGLSFDLNVKQYLNGFVDIISGIGKTKAPKPATNNSQ